MRRGCGSIRALGSTQKVFLTILLLCLGSSGCDNTCVLFVSNPGGGVGTISGNGPSCSLNQTNGNVRVRMTSPVAPSTGEGRPRIQHIFVTLQGIEANPSAIADEQSPDWQELAPKLATQPLQLDLLAQSGDSCEADAFESAAVHADAYRQIRLRLAQDQAESGDAVLQENSCGNAGLNCAVYSDGSVRGLVVGDKASQIQVSSEQIAGGFFRILPRTSVNLKIEFNPQASLFIPADEAVRLVPHFTAESQSPCEGTAAADQ